MHYRQLSVFSVLSAAPLANLAKTLAPPWNDIRVKHSWNAVPHSWETLGHPPAGTTINLHLALKPHHENALTDALYKVSDPESPEHVLSNTLPRTTYGAHLSKEQVAQLVAPHPDTLELIYSWLGHHGVPSSSVSTTQGGSGLTLTGVPVSQANELLGASYQVYQRTGTNDSTILRTIGYALPTVLHEHVRTVVPTTYFASTRNPNLRQTPRRRTGETADMASSGLPTDKVKPSDLRRLYKTFGYVPAAMDRNVLGIASYLNSYPSPTDLTAFMIKCRTDAVDATYTVEQPNGGGYDPSHPDGEANLSMQYTQAIAYPTPHVFYSTGGEISINSDDNGPATEDMWLKWLDYMLELPKVPQTISTAFGEYEKKLPPEYARTLCDMYAQLGVRGASVIFSSGNDGVGNGDCKANDGSGRVRFVPAFPASCPWVTSVGGTTGEDPEVGANLSGGGFSNHFAQPKYQEDAVPTFLKHLGSQYDGMYNATSRGIPDISAQALRFLIIEDNELYLVDGTSCSAPTVAGIISLLNDYRLSTNKKPLGFLNPLLYGHGLTGINDITSGSNPGCGTEGFSAIVGWDPVTGLGTLNFLALQRALDSVGVVPEAA
ncbi:subtilisin-like protein [Lactarius psammicola]|nr:subtilisin-like protein [Lactarius psammicola]